MHSRGPHIEERYQPYNIAVSVAGRQVKARRTMSVVGVLGAVDQESVAEMRLKQELDDLNDTINSSQHNN